MLCADVVIVMRVRVRELRVRGLGLDETPKL